MVYSIYQWHNSATNFQIMCSNWFKVSSILLNNTSYVKPLLQLLPASHLKGPGNLYPLTSVRAVFWTGKYVFTYPALFKNTFSIAPNLLIKILSAELLINPVWIGNLLPCQNHNQNETFRYNNRKTNKTKSGGFSGIRGGGGGTQLWLGRGGCRPDLGTLTHV